MKVVAFEVEDWEADAFYDLGGEFNVETNPHPLGKRNAEDYSDAQVISTFINCDLGNEVLKHFDDLRLIATRSTGFDHIDLDYCNEHDIAVCNVPDYGANTVAEHVFALLLTISHNMEPAIDRTRKGDFSPRGLQGFDLKGRTLGVIGTGDIGQSVIQIAKGFQMKVLAHDVAPRNDLAEQLGFDYLSLHELLQQSDVITLHVPSNEQTHHMIGERQFHFMKDKAVLINTARGDVIDIRAMVRALAEGKLAAAGLDVLPNEPVIREEAELLRSIYERKHDLQTLLADHVLAHLRNVIITPHSAFNTREAVERIIDTTRQNIEAFAQGQPQNLVNADAVSSQ